MTSMDEEHTMKSLDADANRNVLAALDELVEDHCGERRPLDWLDAPMKEQGDAPVQAGVEAI